MSKDEKQTLTSGKGYNPQANETLTGGIGAASSDDTLTKMPSISAGRRTEIVNWRIGDIIDGKYEVKDVIGKGGMGIVYKVHHRDWNIEMAVKMPLAELVSDKASKARFVREAQTWVDLGLHPNIVQCWYVRELGGVPRVFMDFMKGGSLRNWIKEGKVKPGEWDQIVDLMIQACDGLGYAHEKGVVHRDIKPANMLMSEDGRLSITDFGIVKLREVEDIEGGKANGSSISSPFTMTATGSNLGTPEYGAPELWGKARHADARTDIYALGVILYELCCGCRPFDDGTHSEPANVIIGRHIATPVPAIKKLNSDVPDNLTELILQCLSKEPDNRPGNTAELRDNLVNLFETKGRTYFRKKPKSADLLADALNNKAVSLWDLGNQKTSETVFKEALGANPHHLAATYNQAIINWHEGEIDDLEVISRLEGLNTPKEDSGLFNYMLGLCHLERGDLDGSIASIKKAIEKQPGAHHFWKTLGRICLIANDALGAKRAFSKAANIEHHDEESDSILRHLLSLKPAADMSADIADRISLNNTFIQQVRTLKPETTSRHRFGYEEISFKGSFIKGKTIMAVDAGNSRVLVEMASGCQAAVIDFLGTQPLFVIHYKDLRYLSDACFSPDGKLILLRGPDKMAVWDTKLSAIKSIISFDPNEMNIEDISPRAAVIHPEGSIYVIDQGMPGEPPVIHTVLQGDTRLLPLCVGHTDHINSIDLDFKHDRLLTSSRDGTAKLWDAYSGSCLLTLKNKGILSASFSQSGKRVFTFSRTGKAILWDISNQGGRRLFGSIESEESNLKLKVFNTHPDYPIGGVSDPSSSLLATWNKHWSNEKRKSLPGPIRIWNMKTGQCLRSFPNHNPSYNGLLGFIESGSILFAYSASIRMNAWELPTLQQKVGLEICRLASTTEVISEKSKIDQLISRARKMLEQKRYKDAYECARSAQKITGHEFNPRVVRIIRAVYPHGKRLNLIRYWNIQTMWSADKKPVTALGFLNENKVVSGTAYGALQVWDFSTGRCLKKLIGHYNSIVLIIDVPSAGLFVSMDQDDIHENNMRVWNSASYRCVSYLKAYGDVFRSLAVSNDGTMAASVDGKNKLYIWDIEIEELDYTIDIPEETGKIYSITFKEDNANILLQCDQNKWLDINLKNKKTFFKTVKNKQVISEDQIYPRLSIQNTTVLIENQKTGALLAELGGHHEKVLSCNISADNRYVISGDESGCIRYTELDWELSMDETN